MAAMYRQGDVLLVEQESLPEKAVRKSADDRIVLAWGEVTGHAHAVSSQYASLYVANEERFLVALEGAQLTHEEHSAIALVPGVYKVIQQREYTPGAVRNVAD